MVTISKVKIFSVIRKHTVISLRVFLILILSVVGILPGILSFRAIVATYEERAVSLKTAEIQNQCTILGDQLYNVGYLTDTSSEVINANLAQLTSIYDGRAIVADQYLTIVKDTYGLDQGKKIVSENAIQATSGVSSSNYDKENGYIEVSVPIQEEDGIKGLIVMTISTSSIEESLDILNSKGWAITGAIDVVIVVLALFIAAGVVRPMNKIAKQIEHLSEGYAKDPLQVNIYHETRRISRSVNTMLDRLKVMDESRDEFVSNVSHELKTPLTSMKVLADSLVIQDEVPNELYREFMEDIAKEIDRENDIINDLLSLVKLDQAQSGLNITSVDVNELLESSMKRLKPIAQQKNIEFLLESFKAVNADLDRTKISLAFTNLMENAIKYNKDDGWVHVTLNADHKYFYVTVADSGIGIPEEAQNRIFERFYRVDKSHSREIGGTGLGLAITRRVILLHRGSIKVYSKPGEGSTFSVRIPLTFVSS